MSQADTNLTPAQRALQELAIRQMTAVLETLRRLEGITPDPAARDGTDIR